MLHKLVIAMWALKGAHAKSKKNSWQNAGATFNRLATSGDVINGKIFGQVRDINGNPIFMTNANVKTNITDISNNEDYPSMFTVGNSVFSCVHFESPRPGEVQCLKNVQDPDTGVLTPVDLFRVDFSADGGVWVPCAGSTYHNRHLGSEEYEPDAKRWGAFADSDSLDLALAHDGTNSIPAFVRYFGLYKDPNNLADWTVGKARELGFNPYNYGHVTDIEVLNESGEIRAVKHFSMSRQAVELPRCIDNPKKDQTVCYITDDGTNVQMTMFVTEKMGDLTSGRLYGAKAIQNTAGPSLTNITTFDIQWTPLGGLATDKEIRDHVRAGIKFTDMFEIAAPVSVGVCPEGFTSINTGGPTDIGHECLKVKAGMETVASRLETRRFGAMMGSTTEWNKMEGFTISPNGKVIAVSMSWITGGMVAGGPGDVGGPDDIRVIPNPCGCVYAGTLDENYHITKLYPLVCGNQDGNIDPARPITGCNLDSIGEPDNLSFMNEDVLLIGEDTNVHQNDMVWAYRMSTGELTRIGTCPLGSESTGLYWHDNINGFSYITMSTQHPYGESDQDKLPNPAALEGYVSYMVFDVKKPGSDNFNFMGITPAVTDAEKAMTRFTTDVYYTKMNPKLARSGKFVWDAQHE